MKVLLLVLSVFIVGCSSGAKKTVEEKPAAKVEESQPAPVNQVEAKEEPKVAATKFSKNVVCTYGETTRTLENKYGDNGGCEVIYTKDEVADSIANAQNEMEYCQEIVDRIANKLAGAGFNCKDVAAAEKQ